MQTTLEKKPVAIGKGWEGDVKITRVHFYTKVPDGELLETSKYQYFKLDEKNRPIHEEKVNHFMKLFKSGKNFMKEFPCIVAKDLTILDGQHRFEATRRLELPIYFRFATTLTIDSVVDVQINAGWKVEDYIHAFIKQKKQDYVVLHRFMKRYSFSVSTAIILLQGRASNGGSGIARSGFYEGSFRVKDETSAHEWAKAIIEIGELALKLHRDRSFCLAIVKLMNHPDYEQKRMVSQITKYVSLMIRQVTVDGYIRNLEEIYNYKLFTKNKVRFI